MPIRSAGPPDLGGPPFALESLRLTQTRRPRNAHIRRMVADENRRTLGTSVLSALVNRMINRNSKSELSCAHRTDAPPVIECSTWMSHQVKALWVLPLR
jgi:hypothetical protein